VLKIRHYAKPQTVSGHAWATDENLKLTAKNEQTKTQFIIKRTDNKFNFGEI
jgi:hypothetical protein